MINEGALIDSAKVSIQLIRDIGILANSNSMPIYPESMPSELRVLSYEDAWKKCIKKEWYNIILEDSSILQFSRNGYKYIMTPFNSLSYDEFVERNFPEPEWLEDPMLSHDIIQQYDDYIDSQRQSQPAMPVRFDVDYDYYCEHIHPLYHFHFGVENESRIPVKRLLTPLSFTAFIVRSFYPKKWKVFSEEGGIENYIRSFKENLASVPTDYWKAYENRLLYIS
ncbi:DUF2290 domain-containing protein [Serratia liquefaciens]|uniref:DUF2290 domain-containing protein n=1 Tax=Serratia liquefaciens TaxID=614 RepID=UPI00165D0C2D|nr:DUF2290 domain-containing protein [Serratia liquefaciens]QNQ53415.1 DUF2290 domain-containing protein [Serratia liquefaciens]